MIRNLEYRTPRVQVWFGIEFVAGSMVFRGSCIDVNESGLRASLGQPIAVGTEGLLTMNHPSRRTTVRARVVYLLKGQVSFMFLDDTVEKRESLTLFKKVPGFSDL